MTDFHCYIWRLNEIDVSPQDHTVRLGPGSPRTNVYDTLAHCNLTVAGGRISVGGLLLGGTLSFVAARLTSRVLGISDMCI
jgi:hypothetical protein